METVLITGANRGLGLEMAKQLKKLNFEVIGTVRDLEKSQHLKELGVQVEEVDTSNQNSIKMLAEKLQDTPIDILINNAGILIDGGSTLESFIIEDMIKTFTVNSVGPLLTTRHLLSSLQKGNKKLIVNISSNAGSIGNNTAGGMYAYRASKAALNQLTKTMSLELGTKGFTTVEIHPGWVSTDMGGSAAPLVPEESVEKILQVVQSLDKSHNGKFLDLEGVELSW